MLSLITVIINSFDLVDIGNPLQEAMITRDYEMSYKDLHGDSLKWFMSW